MITWILLVRRRLQGEAFALAHGSNGTFSRNSEVKVLTDRCLDSLL